MLAVRGYGRGWKRGWVAFAALAVLLGVTAGMVAWAHRGDNHGGPGANARRVRFSVTGPRGDRVHVSYDNGRRVMTLAGNVELPFIATLRINSRDQYEIHAVVLKGGSINCQVKIGGVVKEGHASGAGHTCSASLSWIAPRATVGGWY